MTEPLQEIKKTVILNAPLERVWKAVTTPEGIASWWMESTFKPVVGHKFVLHAGEFGESPGEVTQVEPMKLISFNWEKDWQVTFLLNILGENKTEFTLIHSGWDAEKKTKFGQGHTSIREVMDGGWERNVKEKLPKSLI